MSELTDLDGYREQQQEMTFEEFIKECSCCAVADYSHTTFPQYDGPRYVVKKCDFCLGALKRMFDET